MGCKHIPHRRTDHSACSCFRMSRRAAHCRLSPSCETTRLPPRSRRHARRRRTWQTFAAPVWSIWSFRWIRMMMWPLVGSGLSRSSVADVPAAKELFAALSAGVLATDWRGWNSTGTWRHLQWGDTRELRVGRRTDVGSTARGAHAVRDVGGHIVHLLRRVGVTRGERGGCVERSTTHPVIGRGIGKDVKGSMMEIN
jgi:hypothetical protein